MPSAELKGKVAWITGGGSGIGLAGALELAKAGAAALKSYRIFDFALNGTAA